MVAVQQEKAGRERILAAARCLFSTHGFHQTSMAELAAAAQVSVGQIYRLFKGKEDVIKAIVHGDADDWAADMDVLRTRLHAGELTVDKTFELLLLTIDAKDEALSFDILAEAIRNPDIGEMIGKTCVRFRGYIRDFACIANPDLSGDALDGAEEMILACMFGLGHRTLSRPNLTAVCTARRSAQMIVAALKGLG